MATTETIGLNLTKGDSIELNKEMGKVLTRVNVAAGWDIPRAPGAAPVDLDLSAMLFNEKKERIDYVYFNKKESVHNAVWLDKDNLTGDDSQNDEKHPQDDETIHVDIDKLPAEVKYILFTITIYTHNQTFGIVKSAFGRIYDAETDVEIARQELDSFGEHTAVYLCSLERTGSGLKYKAIWEPGEGHTFEDLKGHAPQYL